MSKNPKSATSVEKTGIIQGRLLVATVNLAAIDIYGHGRAGIVFSYNFTRFISDVKKASPKNVSVAELTSLIRRKSRAKFEGFDRYIAGGAVEKSSTPNPFIEYFVAGYESSIPTVNRVYFQINWLEARLEGPFVETVHPSRNAKVTSDFFAAGWNEVVAELRDRQSDAYAEMLVLIPKELPKLSSDQDLAPKEATNACLAVLRYEAKHHKPCVNPPFTVFTIPPFGMGSVSRDVHPN